MTPDTGRKLAENFSSAEKYGKIYLFWKIFNALSSKLILTEHIFDISREIGGWEEPKIGQTSCFWAKNWVLRA